MLTDQTRYRITGAIFLLALAIIVLPMLFDGDGIEKLKLSVLTQESIDVTLAEGLGPGPDMRSAEVARENLRKEIDADGYRVENGTKFGEPVLSDDTDSLSRPALSWAVQVASFSEEENAIGLRDRLQVDGYSSLLSRVKEQGEKRIRVAVGPMINREDAMILKTELAERYSLETLVVRFGY